MPSGNRQCTTARMKEKKKAGGKIELNSPLRISHKNGQSVCCETRLVRYMARDKIFTVTYTNCHFLSLAIAPLIEESYVEKSHESVPAGAHQMGS